MISLRIILRPNGDHPLVWAAQRIALLIPPYSFGRQPFRSLSGYRPSSLASTPTIAVDARLSLGVRCGRSDKAIPVPLVNSLDPFPPVQGNTDWPAAACSRPSWPFSFC